MLNKRDLFDKVKDLYKDRPQDQIPFQDKISSILRAEYGDSCDIEKFVKNFIRSITDKMKIFRNAKSLMDSKKHKIFFDTNIVFDQPQQSHMVVPDPPPPPLHIVTTAVQTENSYLKIRQSYISQEQ